MSTTRAARYEARYPPIGALQRIELDGRGYRLHVLDQGPAAPEAIVLLHGASGNLRDFAFGFMDALAAHPAGAGRRIMALDRPGFGHSDRGPCAAHRPDVQARMLRAAVRARGVERVTLLGHSLGAATALAWALAAPAETRGVVDVSGATHPWPGLAGISYEVFSAPVLGAAAARAAEALIDEAWAARAIGSIFAPQTPPDGYAAYLGVGLALRAATLRANAFDIAKLKRFLRKQAARYPGMTTPIEIVHGAADTVVPARIHSEPLARVAPTARLTLLEDVGHMPHHGAAEAVFDALGRIFARSAA